MKFSTTSNTSSQKDYDPFGMLTIGRSWQVGSEYRYGFNGKECDPETYGSANIYDYGFRIYNPRLGKFLSVDPISKSYPWYTPYQFAGNAPIWAVDLDGLEQAIVIRWYNAAGNWTGTAVLSIENTTDRPLGSNNFLYLNLEDTPNNQSSINRLFSAVSAPNPVVSADPRSFTSFFRNNRQGSAAPTITDFTGNPIQIQDAIGNLTFGVAFTRPLVSTEDANVLANTRAQINAGNAALGLSFPTPDVIYFSFGLSQYDPTLDPDGNTQTNGQELAQASAKLNQNPDRVATVVGNSSTPDLGGTNNQALSTNRANVVSNLLATASRAPTRVANGGGMSNRNATGNNNLDQNSTINYNIPRQSR